MFLQSSDWREAPHCMKTVQKSVLIWYSAQEMYDLVHDVPRYPEFLPWCESAAVDAVHADGVTARIGMALAGFKRSFSTRNVVQAGRQIRLELVDGPFKRLEGTWDFIPLQSPDGQAQRACRVELSLHYEFESVFGKLVGPIFDKIAATLIDAFVKRAEQVYG